MLELNKTHSIKEIENFKDFVTIVYAIVDDTYQEIILTHIKNRRHAGDSVLGANEVITISNVA